MRGDRPWKALSGNAKHTFTPHARGSTFGKTLPESFSTVYPACAGIDLDGDKGFATGVSLPRMRGDRPAHGPRAEHLREFTPHARGSTAHRRAESLGERVYPACAGIDPSNVGTESAGARLPRMRGDRPQLLPSKGSYYVVYPACAGIDLDAVGEGLVGEGLPRMRGDRPCCKYSLYVLFRFTPHARGSTGCRMCYDLHAVVYPACAGIDPACSGLKNREPGLPRMRGDRPAVNPLTRVTKGFTPHARGSTSVPYYALLSRCVYPACAGIDLKASYSP